MHGRYNTPCDALKKDRFATNERRITRPYENPGNENGEKKEDELWIKNAYQSRLELYSFRAVRAHELSRITINGSKLLTAAGSLQ